jgi:hypothetical protein
MPCPSQLLYFITLAITGVRVHTAELLLCKFLNLPVTSSYTKLSTALIVVVLIRAVKLNTCTYMA